MAQLFSGSLRVQSRGNTSVTIQVTRFPTYTGRDSLGGSTIETADNFSISWQLFEGDSTRVSQRGIWDFSGVLRSETISGLKTGTSYRFVHNWSATGHTTTADSTLNFQTTGSVVDPPAPTNFQSTAQTDNSVTFTWDRTNSNAEIRYRRSGVVSWGEYIDTGSRTGYTLTGLASGTTYEFQLFQETGNRRSMPANLTGIATTGNVVNPPQNVSLRRSRERTSLAGINIAWRADWDAATGQTYEFRWKNTLDASWSDWIDRGDRDFYRGTIEPFISIVGLTIEVRAVEGTRRSIPVNLSFAFNRESLETLTAPTLTVATTANSATISWTETAGITYHYQWKPLHDLVYSQWAQSTSPITLSNLTDGQSYAFLFYARRTSDSNTSPPEYRVITATAAVTVDPPTNLQLSARTNGFAVTWTESASSPDNYEISWKLTTSNAWSSWINTSGNSSHTISGLTSSTSYDVRIRAKKGTVYSTIVSTMLSTLAVAQPTLNLTATDTTITATWTAVSGLTYEYRIRQGTNAFSSWTSATTPLTISGRTASTEYTVELRAKDASNNLSTSSSSTITTSTAETSVQSPQNLAETSTETSITITWTASTGLTYEFRSKTGSNAFSAWTATSSTSSHTISNLVPNTSYQIELRAKDSADNLSATRSITSSTNAITAPANLTLSFAQTSITATWTASTGTGHVSEYRYRQGSNAWSAFTQATSPVTISNLLAGLSYEVEVRTKSGSHYSDEISSTGSTVALLTAPTNLTFRGTDTKIDCSWIPVSGQNYTYQIRRSTGPGTFTTWTDTTENDFYQFTGLTAGTSYEFQVRSKLGNDFSSSLSSNFSTSSTAIPSITDLQSEVTPSSIRLTWTRPASTYTYEIRWRETAGTFNDWRNIGNVANYQITGLNPATAYNVDIRTISVNYYSDPPVSTSPTTRNLTGLPAEIVLPTVSGSAIIADILDRNGDKIGSGPLKINTLEFSYVLSEVGTWNATFFSDVENAELIEFPNEIMFREAGSTHFLGIGLIEEVNHSPLAVGKNEIQVSGYDQLNLLQFITVPKSIFENLSSFVVTLQNLEDRINQIYSGWNLIAGFNPSLRSTAISVEDNITMIEALRVIADYSSTVFYLSGNKEIQFINPDPSLDTIRPTYRLDFSSSGREPDIFGINPGIQIKKDTRDIVTRVYPTDSAGRDASDNSFGGLRSGYRQTADRTGVINGNIESSYGIRELRKKFPDAKPLGDSSVDRNYAANSLIQRAQDYLYDNSKPKVTYNLSANITMNQRIPSLLGRRITLNLQSIKDTAKLTGNAFNIEVYAQETRLSVVQDGTRAKRTYNLTLTDGTKPTQRSEQRLVSEIQRIEKQTDKTGFDVNENVRQDLGFNLQPVPRIYGISLGLDDDDQIESTLTVDSSTYSSALSGTNLIAAIDEAVGNTTWRTGVALSAAQIENLLDTRYGNTRWRTWPDSDYILDEIDYDDLQDELDDHFGNTTWRAGPGQPAAPLTDTQIGNAVNRFVGNTDWQSKLTALQVLFSFTQAMNDSSVSRTTYKNPAARAIINELDRIIGTNSRPNTYWRFFTNRTNLQRQIDLICGGSGWRSNKTATLWRPAAINRTSNDALALQAALRISNFNPNGTSFDIRADDLRRIFDSYFRTAYTTGILRRPTAGISAGTRAGFPTVENQWYEADDLDFVVLPRGARYP